MGRREREEKRKEKREKDEWELIRAPFTDSETGKTARNIENC